MPNRTQDDRAIGIETPLGKDVLLLKGFSLNEEMGRPFTAQLDLRSEKPDIDFNQIIGKNVTIRLNLSTGAKRFINGYIARFSQEEAEGEGTANKYRATLVPWFWFLSRTADCRLFQNKKIPDIIKEIFGEYKFADFEFRLTGTYQPKEYVVQYRESAFNFVSRLLEHEGIYYFFKHEKGKHLMILTDSPAKHEAPASGEEVKFVGSERAKIGFERVWDWQAERRLQTGKVALVDFDYRAPTKNLYAQKADPKQHDLSSFEFFDYPGQYVEHADGETYAQVRAEEFGAQHAVSRATGDVRYVSAGDKIKLTGHPRADQNAEYVVVSAACSATVDDYDMGGKGSGEETVRCSFNVIPAAVQFRPLRSTPKPRVAGPQTAIVVSVKEGDGEEVYTDEFGRVKVHFHWDRYNKAEDPASCWIRVAQLWAGKGWGAMYLPRVGQEVIVDFLEGDPDQPVITGRVYNKECMPPYALPDNKTVSTLKSSSSKGGSGFNEIRFEDKAGSEQIFINAQKQLDVRVLQDSYEWVGKTRHTIIEDAEFQYTKKARHDKIGDQYRLEVAADASTKISGKQMIEIGGAQSIKVTGNVGEKISGNHAIEVSGNSYIKAAGVVIESTGGITLKCGGNSVVIDSSGVTLKGSAVTLDGSMTKINSGPGSPPSSGSPPQIEAPQAPDAAKEADKAEAGQVSSSTATTIDPATYGSATSGSSEAASSQSDPGQSTGPLTWVGVKLFNQQNQPVPGVTYKIKMSDGSEQTGTLDEEGKARVEGVPQGSVEITFPDLHPDEWSKK